MDKMTAKPFRGFLVRFFNFAFSIIISGSTFSWTDGAGYRGELFHCPSEGFHPDPADCKIFYRCVDWNINSFRKSSDSSLTAFQFTCGEGTVFDPDLNVCNHPRDTSRAECGGRRAPPRNQYPFRQFPQEGNAGGYAGGVAYLPANESAYLSRRIQGGSAYADEYPYPLEDNNKYPWQIDEYEDPVRNVMKISGNCQSEGFFAVEGDCTKFMRCINDGTGRFSMYTFQCGPGTVWDQKNLICNYPYAVSGCGGTRGYNERVPASDYGYDSDRTQAEPENKKGKTDYAGTAGYPAVEDQEDRPPVKDYPGLGNYPYHGIYSEQYPPAYGPENNFQQSNYPVINPGQTTNGNVPYHTTYSEAQFQGKYSQTEYYFTGDNFNNRPGQNGFQASGPPTYGRQPHTPIRNRTNQIVQQKRPNQLSHPGQVKQNYRPKYENQGSYTVPDGYENGPKTSPAIQIPQSQISPLNKPSRPSDQERKGYTNQMHGNSYPQPESSFEESGTLNGDSTECRKDGFFSIPKECKRFFRCVDNGRGGYFRYDFSCGEGTVWDQESTTCNHPWAVKRKDVDCTSEGSASESGPNSFHSTTAQQTVTRDNDTWSRTSTLATPSYSTYPYATVSTTEGREETPQMQHTTSNQESHQYKPTTDKHATPSHAATNKETLDHKGTTNKKGTTTSTTPHERPITDKNRIPEVQPEIKNNTQGNKLNHRDGEISTPPPESTPFTPDKKGKVKCEKAGFYPYPGSCKKYYRCLDWDGDKGERFSVYYFECPTGTIWDPALETCNHEESVYPQRDCQEENQDNKEEKGPSTTSGSTSVTKESMENGTTGEYTTTTSSDNKTPHEATTSSNIDTTTHAPEEHRTTTIAEDSSSESTKPADFETTTASSTDEPSSAVTTTDSTATTIYDNAVTSEQPMLSTTTMTTTDRHETLHTSNHRTETVYASTQETMFTFGQTTETTYASADISDSTTEPAFTDAEQGEGTTTQIPSKQNHTLKEESPNCPVLGSDQVAYVCPTGFRRHPRECNNFYQCTITKEGDVNIMILSCKNNAVYDERKIQCLPEDETEGCPSKPTWRSRSYRRTEEEKISAVPISSPDPFCPGQGNFPYPEDCRKFFKCEEDAEGRTQGFLYQCPENFSFSEASGKCELTVNLPKCSRFPQDASPSKLRWISSKVPVVSLAAEVR